MPYTSERSKKNEKKLIMTKRVTNAPNSREGEKGKKTEKRKGLEEKIAVAPRY